MATVAVAAGFSLLQAQEKKKAGVIEKRESEIIASQIEVAAAAREADRKERLAKSIASQNAAAGASGIAAFEGSPLSVLEADISAAETAQERDTFQTELAAMTTRVRGRVAKSAASQSAFTGLIGDFASVAKTT